ncbi:MAG: GNAT family N-acetyltransferase [Halodesulfurarchaeum sp.]|nr:GNAT family N-acetyltransferase [Halodesulfurarchaeum sp.]
MAFEIVEATVSDVDEILECWVNLVEGQRSYGSHIVGEPNRAAARDLLGQYVAGDMLDVATATDGGAEELLGFVMFYRESGLYEQSVVRGVIENVYVKPRVRGQGIGSALLSRAETKLADRGADVVAISAMAENETAIQWYRDRGYTPQRLMMERSLEED